MGRSASMRKFKSRLRGRGLNKKQSTQVGRIVRRNMEKKHYDYTATATSVSAAGSVVALSQPSQGDADTARDGDEIQPVNFQFRAYLTKGDSTNLVRLILLQWKVNTDKATPTGTDVLNGFAGDGTLDLVRNYTQDSKPMIRILHDRVYNLNDDQTTRLIKVNVSRKKLLKRIQFDAGTNSGTNKIYAIFFSDSGAAAHPSMTYYSRLTYTDA